jgi:hypothetical protein
MVHFFCCWELIGGTSNTANLKAEFCQGPVDFFFAAVLQIVVISSFIQSSNKFSTSTIKSPRIAVVLIKADSSRICCF